MRQKNHIIRRVTVLVAALATLLSGGALPAAGSESAPADPATSRPPAAPSTEPAAPQAPTAAAAAPSGTAASSGATAASGSTAPGNPAAPSSPEAPPSPGQPQHGQPPQSPQSPQQAQPPQDSASPQDSPSSPQAPRISHAPRSPESPEASGTPETSQAPSAPQPPQGPQALQDPAAPEAPADPRAPGAPGVSGTPSLIRGDPRSFGAQIFKGYAFDTCQAPSGATMRAWKKSSPYGAVGVYIGGRGRACPNQKYLNRSWVKAAHSMGWKFLPLYVGSQSPCVGAANKRKVLINSSAPYQQGRREGLDAVRQAQRLGMVRHSAVYLDMEAYNYKNTRCAATTLRFIQGWNSAVRARGYVAGFYSSADSGIAHLEQARASGARGLPTAMWFARWRVPKSVDNERRIHRSAWQPHRRIHQFTGNVTRKYGGHSVNIDQNLMDAPVAVIG